MAHFCVRNADRNVRKLNEGLTARGSIGWTYGTRQYRVGLRHEAVHGGLMARGSIVKAYGTRQ